MPVEKRKTASPDQDENRKAASPDLDEAKVKFPTEVIGQSTVVVVDSQVGRAHLQHFNVSESFHDCSQF